MIDDKTSLTISNLRFPLIVLIVLIHSYISDITIGGASYKISIERYPLYSNLSFFLSRVISHIAVPLFGLISGYLYFNNLKKNGGFTWEMYINKTKSRCKSLLVPYLFWNTALLLIYAVGQAILPDLTGGSRKLIADYTVIDYLNSYWAIDDGCPMCFQLWFIRDLFVVSLLSPVIFYAIKYCGKLLILLIVLAFLAGLNIPIPTLESSVISFFVIGAFLSIKKIPLVFNDNILWLYLGYSVLVIATMVLYNFSNTENSLPLNLARKCSVIIGVVIMPNVVSKMFKSKHYLLGNSSFFLYATHAFVLSVFLRLTLKVVIFQSDIVLTTIYMAIPAITILIITVLFCILNKYLPRFTRLITGGRI